MMTTRSRGLIKGKADKQILEMRKAQSDYDMSAQQIAGMLAIASVLTEDPEVAHLWEMAIRSMLFEMRNDLTPEERDEVINLLEDVDTYLENVPTIEQVSDENVTQRSVAYASYRGYEPRAAAPRRRAAPKGARRGVPKGARGGVPKPPASKGVPESRVQKRTLGRQIQRGGKILSARIVTRAAKSVRAVGSAAGSAVSLVTSKPWNKLSPRARTALVTGTSLFWTYGVMPVWRGANRDNLELFRGGIHEWVEANFSDNRAAAELLSNFLNGFRSVVSPESPGAGGSRWVTGTEFSNRHLSDSIFDLLLNLFTPSGAVSFFSTIWRLDYAGIPAWATQVATTAAQNSWRMGVSGLIEEARKYGASLDNPAKAFSFVIGAAKVLNEGIDFAPLLTIAKQFLYSATVTFGLATFKFYLQDWAAGLLLERVGVNAQDNPNWNYALRRLIAFGLEYALAPEVGLATAAYHGGFFAVEQGGRGLLRLARGPTETLGNLLQRAEEIATQPLLEFPDGPPQAEEGAELMVGGEGEGGGEVAGGGEGGDVAMSGNARMRKQRFGDHRT